jgi:phosphatidylglycerol:prolipoprotein diacylglycerol transferase
VHPILYRFPEAWPLVGGWPIRSFSVMVLIGVLIAAWWLRQKLFAERTEENDRKFDSFLWRCLVVGFIGARLTYVAVHPEVYHGFLSLFAFWEGGLVSYGGFFGGALGGLWFCKSVGMKPAVLGDVALPALTLGQVFGRVGCLLVGDDHGAPWDGPWSVTFTGVPDSLIPPDLVGVPLHPSQIYLSLMNVVIFATAAWLYRRRRFDGQVMAVTMMMYAVGRFLVEYTRGDFEARGMFSGLSTAQWWSFATFALAAVLALRFRGAARPPEPTGG